LFFTDAAQARNALQGSYAWSSDLLYTMSAL
jgi:hypothetical protein